MASKQASRGLAKCPLSASGIEPTAGTMSQARAATTMPWLQSRRGSAGGRKEASAPSRAKTPPVSTKEESGAHSRPARAQASGRVTKAAVTSSTRPR